MENIGLIFDSGNKIGGGHFWRCYNLAKILKKKERNFFFISNNLNKSFTNFLNNENFFYKNVDDLKHLSSIKNIIKKNNLDTLIVDFYTFNENKKINLKKTIKTLIVIDDHINKKHYCDIFINNNFLSKSNKNLINILNPNSENLIGHHYFINSNKIIPIRQKKREKPLVKNIFVFFGTSDETNETIKLIKAVKYYKNFNFYILVGKLNKKINEIKSISEKIQNIKIYYNLTNVETLKLIKNKDLAFGSGGINLTERLFLKIPSVAICTAKNQQISLNNLKKKKIIFHLGNHDRVEVENIKKFIMKIVKYPKIINTLKKNMQKHYGNKYDPILIKNKINKFLKKNEKKI